MEGRGLGPQGLCGTIGTGGGARQTLTSCSGVRLGWLVNVGVGGVVGGVVGGDEQVGSVP